jgi:hypothetical protein
VDGATGFSHLALSESIYGADSADLRSYTLALTVDVCEVRVYNLFTVMLGFGTHGAANICLFLIGKE